MNLISKDQKNSFNDRIRLTVYARIPSDYIIMGHYTRRDFFTIFIDSNP